MSLEQKKQKNLDLASNVLPHFTIEDLIANGAHFGHKTSKWNHQMKPFIFGSRNGIHIIDVRKTHAHLVSALLYIYKAVRSGKSVLFVSTRPNVREVVKEYAIKCGQPYVTHRWLGGMLTNWRTIVSSIKKIKKYEKILSEVDEKNRHGTYSKKELGVISKSLDKLKIYFDGLRGITARPDVVVIFDTNKDKIAVQEANKLCISAIGLVDTNSSITDLEYIIPCNDDSKKIISFMSNLICETVLKAIKDEVSSYNIDINVSTVKKQEDLKMSEVAAKKIKNVKKIIIESEKLESDSLMQESSIDLKSEDVVDNVK